MRCLTFWTFYIFFCMIYLTIIIVNKKKRNISFVIQVGVYIDFLTA